MTTPNKASSEGLIIDLDAPAPFVEENIYDKVVHVKGGVHLWQPEKFVCFALRKQKSFNLSGKQVLEEIEARDLPLCNVNMQRFITDHQCLGLRLVKVRICFPMTRIVLKTGEGYEKYKYNRTAFVPTSFHSGRIWSEGFSSLGQRFGDRDCFAAYPVDGYENRKDDPIVFLD